MRGILGAAALRLLALSIVALAAGATAGAQNHSAAGASQTQATFILRAQRNLVLVRVIVRDAQGHPVDNLRKEDFLLFDNRKPQLISQFAVEHPGRETAPVSNSGSKPGVPAPAVPPAANLPQRFLALYFDDVHLNFEDVNYTRDAAKRYLGTALQPGVRIGLFTSSGIGNVDFTSDRDKLDAALNGLRPYPLTGGELNPCPDLSPYEAYLIEEKHDITALQIATEEVIECLCNGASQGCPYPEEHARTKATEVMQQNEFETRDALRVIESLVRVLASKPGERNMVMVSPGFLDLTALFDVDDIIDRALRANVTISALDARGLYAFLPLGDASKHGVLPMNQIALMGSLIQIRNTGDTLQSDALASLADGTGGVFFHNSNDYDAGFRRTGALPEVYYVLAFTPQDLKYDGRFHSLKVTLADRSHLTIEARKGYFAPKKAADASELAVEEMHDAVYSQQETRAIPIEVHTQFFKAASSAAKLAVFTHVDLRALRFRKENGRNLDTLEVVTALFDDAGNLVTGQKKTLELRLLDSTLARLTPSGVEIRSDLQAKPGTYLLRTVVRDTGDSGISAVNHPVEIPD